MPYLTHAACADAATGSARSSCAYLTSLAACDPPATAGTRAGLLGLAVDGKTLRGSRTAEGTVHLLTAIHHETQTVTAQAQVAANSNEIPAFTPLLSTCSSSKATSPRCCAGSRPCPGARPSSTTAPTNADIAAVRSAA
jgi:hypothetical protein